MLKYIVGLVAFLLIVPALLPSQFNVERSIIINDSQEDIYSYLVNLESWNEWSPWYAQEPDAKYEFSGTPGVVGSASSWDGEIIGTGKQTLVALEEPKYLEMQLEFTKPQESQATAYMKLSEKAQGVEVLWGLKGDLSYPIERVFGLFMDSMVGKDYETGLKSLKKKLENKP